MQCLVMVSFASLLFVGVGMGWDGMEDGLQCDGIYCEG